MKFSRSTTLSFLLLSFVIITSCSDNGSNATTFDNESFRFSNDVNELERRYTGTDITIDIDTTVVNQSKQNKMPPPSFDLRQVSELAPPTIDGEQVQATMVYNDGSTRSIISYNQRGAAYQGAIDIAQINGTGRNINIRSSIEFFNADVNAVFSTSGNLFASLSTDDPSFVTVEERSAALSLDFSGFDILPNTDNASGVPSFAATSVKAFNDQIYITSGNTGGLTIFNNDLSQVIAYFEIPEARWVDVTSDYIVVLSGDSNGDQNGSLFVYRSSDRTLIDEFSFGGAYTPEAKNTVQVVGDLAFIAAGKEGTKVMNLLNGAVVANIPIPDPASLGLSPDVVSTNAVSADENKVFISNGEAGVYVAETNKNITSYAPGESLSLTLIGKLQFDALQSVNHVSYRNKLLIVAAGLGGIKTVSLSDK